MPEINDNRSSRQRGCHVNTHALQNQTILAEDAGRMQAEH